MTCNRKLLPPLSERQEKHTPYIITKKFVVASSESVSAGDVVVYLENVVKRGSWGIVFGSNYDFGSGNITSVSAAVFSYSKFVIVNTDNKNSAYGTTIVGGVSGNTVSYGSEDIFNSATKYGISVATLSYMGSPIITDFFSPER